MSTVHANRDLMTDECLDCGARRDEIDDNLPPTCEKVSGPHRLAIIALERISRSRRRSADRLRDDAAAANEEERAVGLSRAAHRGRAEAEAIAASAALLRSLNPQPESPSRIMQRAADAILNPARS